MGNCNVDQVMTKLIVAKDQADVRRGDEHKAEMVREERVAEISNQESEYETSLRADREKMRLEQEEKRFVQQALKSIFSFYQFKEKRRPSRAKKMRGGECPFTSGRNGRAASTRATDWKRCLDPAFPLSRWLNEIAAF